MKYTLVIFALIAGCSTTNFYEPDLQQFDWVEPLEFQHNLMTCRVQDYCRVETLFG